MVHPELVVLHGDEGIDDVARDLGEGHRLGVLEFIDGDLVAGPVVDVAALGQRDEVGELHRGLPMGVRHPPDLRSDGRDDTGDQQRGGADDEAEAQDPTHAAHGSSVPMGDYGDRS